MQADLSMICGFLLFPEIAFSGTHARTAGIRAQIGVDVVGDQRAAHLRGTAPLFDVRAYSSAKYFSVLKTGFGAEPPSAHNEPSIIAFASSFSRSISLNVPGLADAREDFKHP